MNKSKMCYGIIVLMSFLTCSFNSCKKSSSPTLTDDEQISLAKTWYLKSLENQKTLIKSVNRTANLVFTPDWNNADIEYYEDSFGIIVPVETNLQKITGTTTKFSLVISKVGSDYEAKTVSVKGFNNGTTDNLMSNKELYIASFKDSEISTNNSIELKVFGKKFKVEKELSFDKNGGKISSKGELLASSIEKKMSLEGKVPNTTANGCIFWFLITTDYDGYGNITNVTSVLVSFTCDNTTIDWIQPTEGGPMPEEGQSVSQKENETVIEEEDSGIPKRRIRMPWKFHSAIAWYARSYEIGTQLKTNNEWNWETFTHESHEVVGDFLNSEPSVSVIAENNIFGKNAEATVHYNVSVVIQLNEHAKSTHRFPQKTQHCTWVAY